LQIAPQALQFSFKICLSFLELKCLSILQDVDVNLDVKYHNAPITLLHRSLLSLCDYFVSWQGSSVVVVRFVVGRRRPTRTRVVSIRGEKAPTFTCGEGRKKREETMLDLRR
jgi:hypothetical protein